MVKNHIDNKRENLLPQIHGYSCQLAFFTPVVEHWLEWEIGQWIHQKGSVK